MKNRRKRRENSFSDEFLSVEKKVINPTSSQYHDLVVTRNDLFEKYGGRRKGKEKENEGSNDDTLEIETNGIEIEDEMNFSTNRIENVNNKKREEGISSEEDEGEDTDQSEEEEDEEKNMEEEEEGEDESEEESEEDHEFVSVHLSREEESPRIRHHDPRYDNAGFRRTELLTKIMSDEDAGALGRDDYHQISFDLKNLDEGKLKSNLTSLRSPEKSNVVTDASRMDLLASLHYEEEKLKKLYEESLRMEIMKEEKVIKIKTDPRWWEKVDETFNRDLRRNTKEIRLNQRSPEGKWRRRLEKERSEKEKELEKKRQVWKYTYTKPRFIDNDLYAKHFIK